MADGDTDGSSLAPAAYGGNTWDERSTGGQSSVTFPQQETEYVGSSVAHDSHSGNAPTAFTTSPFNNFNDQDALVKHNNGPGELKHFTFWKIARNELSGL